MTERDQGGSVKVVTKSGDHDGTVIYLFDGQKIIEIQDGSGNMVLQLIHGTRYIDGLVMMRARIMALRRIDTHPIAQEPAKDNECAGQRSELGGGDLAELTLSPMSAGV